MSAFHSLTTLYKDREALIAALNAQGYTDVEVHDVSQPLTGYHGDLRSQKANVIVRRRFVGAASNDLGWEWDTKSGTFIQHISDFDKGKHDSQWCAKLKQSYTEGVTMKTAAKQGFKFLGKKIVAGRVQLQFLDGRA
jgi:Protein of unknown function (DUF1257)